eukprot:s334_g34.t1
MPTEDDKQTCLVLHGRDTKLIHVVPTLQKGGKSLQYLVAEFVRFIIHTQHREIALRSDLEPTNLAIADEFWRTRGKILCSSLYKLLMALQWMRSMKTKKLKARVDVGSEQPVTPPVDDDAMQPSGERAPKTPRLSEAPQQKRMLQVTSTDLSLYEHEDNAVQFQFSNGDLDRLEAYDLESFDDEFLAEEDVSNEANMTTVLAELTFPYSPKEPDLSPEELMRLDALADQLELQRLEKLHVLQDPATVPASSKAFSTRFVEDYIMCSLDVKDAFLTAVQECPTLVQTTGASGNSRSYALGRVLPGQRDGSLLWYKSITSCLKKHLDLEEHAPYPCVLKNDSCIVMIHVEDLLVIGRCKCILGKFAAMLKEVYDISMQCVEKAGDATVFRTRVGILMYLANNVPHAQYTIRHLSTYSSKPTEKSMTVLKHLVSYLASHREISVSLKWCGKTSGIYRQFPDVDQAESVLEVFTDSGWASDRQSKDMDLPVHRQQSSKRHPSTPRSWALATPELPSVVVAGFDLWWSSETLQCERLSGHVNPADIGTKRLSSSRLRSLMSVLGLFNHSADSLEGSDDPGHVFVKRRNVRALLCALSLLNLKGCSGDSSADHYWNLMAFTMVLGLVMLLPLIITWFNWFSSATMVSANVSNEARHKPEQEPIVNEFPSASSSNAAGSTDALPGTTVATAGGSMPVSSSGASGSGAPVWRGVDETGMLRFNSEIELPIPNDMKGDAATRETAGQMTREMCDLSEDETSPTRDLSSAQMTTVIHDAQHAYEIGNQDWLQLQGVQLALQEVLTRMQWPIN